MCYAKATIFHSSDGDASRAAGTADAEPTEDASGASGTSAAALPTEPADVSSSEPGTGVSSSRAAGLHQSPSFHSCVSRLSSTDHPRLGTTPPLEDTTEPRAATCARSKSRGRCVGGRGGIGSVGVSSRGDRRRQPRPRHGARRPFTRCARGRRSSATGTHRPEKRENDQRGSPPSRRRGRRLRVEECHVLPVDPHPRRASSRAARRPMSPRHVGLFRFWCYTTPTANCGVLRASGPIEAVFSLLSGSFHPRRAQCDARASGASSRRARWRFARLPSVIARARSMAPRDALRRWIGAPTGAPPVVSETAQPRRV